MSTRRKNPWTILETRDVYSNPWIHLQESDVINPSGNKSIYGVVHFKNIAVGALAIDEKDRILLVGQHRFALDRYSWEIPEGGCPEGTSVLAAAKRELREETGYRARRWSKLLTLHLSNSVTDERAEIFLAQDLSPGASEPDETEEIEVRWLPLKEAASLVERRVITDAISVAAILHMARLRGIPQGSQLCGVETRAGLEKRKTTARIAPPANAAEILRRCEKVREREDCQGER